MKEIIKNTMRAYIIMNAYRVVKCVIAFTYGYISYKPIKKGVKNDKL